MAFGINQSVLKRCRLWFNSMQTLEGISTTLDKSSPEPSESDKSLTRDLVYAGTMMQIKLLDHIVIGDNRFYSFAGEGWIDRCEMEFAKLKIKT